jgi:hypothetical protein
MFRIQTFNNIAVRGLDRFPRDRYEVASTLQDPDAIMLRSHNLHQTPIPDSVHAVGRAGSGVNNIPVGTLSERGVAVFNAPGANANAVKELVIAGLLLAARNLIPAAEYLRGLDPSDPDFQKRVEDGKKRFVGFELPGRTLGVIGLGAIGVKIANAARGSGDERGRLRSQDHRGECLAAGGRRRARTYRGGGDQPGGRDHLPRAPERPDPQHPGCDPRARAEAGCDRDQPRARGCGR